VNFVDIAKANTGQPEAISDTGVMTTAGRFFSCPLWSLTRALMMRPGSSRLTPHPSRYSEGLVRLIVPTLRRPILSREPEKSDVRRQGPFEFLEGVSPVGFGIPGSNHPDHPGRTRTTRWRTRTVPT
jgi:hypothetical protein